VANLSLSDEPLTGKFVWHDLITEDVAAAQRFYGRLLGWEFESTTHPRGGDYTLVKAGGRYLGGMVQRADGADEDYSRWLPYLSVSDVDRAVRLNATAGGAALIEPLDLGNIGRAAVITDPQGAVLGLLRSRHGDPDDPPETHFGQVYWNELLASDDAAAAEYYRSLAGYRVETIARRGGEYVLLQAQGRERAGVLQRPAPEIAPDWLTHFAVTDVDTAVRRAADMGGTILLAPSDDIREGTFAIVRDPTGAPFALTEFTP
jgi:predicted enzyme related to lactoylglutathione lyase